MGKLDNYVCDGQMDIFDFLGTENAARPKYTCGAWVAKHGRRVKFDEIKPNNYYVADYSTCSHKWLKIVYLLEKKSDSLMYVDDDKGIKRGWRWGNSYSALTRRQYVDCEPNDSMGEAATSGWWYEVEPEEKPTCKHSGHSCNKEELWKIAKEDVNCPQICCRMCNFEDCGARCNGAERSTYKKKPLVWRMSLTAVYTECPYCHMTNTEKHNTSGTYCAKCMKYFDGEVEKKSKEYIEAEKRRENVDDSREGMV